MNYQLRQTDKGLMLYGTVMEKPNYDKYKMQTHTRQLAMDNEEYNKSFQLICPIHKKHQIDFLNYAFCSMTNITPDEKIAKIIEGIEIPTERIGFMEEEYVFTEQGKDGVKEITKYATLLSEQKERANNSASLEAQYQAQISEQIDRVNRWMKEAEYAQNETAKLQASLLDVSQKATVKILDLEKYILELEKENDWLKKKNDKLEFPD